MKYLFNKKINKQQTGLTLVELMVSLALSATLMAGVAQVFVGMRQTDRTQEELSRMQESGRFAINFLAQDIRMAGYIGCASTINTTTANNQIVSNLSPISTPASFQPGQRIQGWEASGTGYGAVSNSTSDVAVTNAATMPGPWVTSDGNVLDSTLAVPGTDVIKVWSASGAGTGATGEAIINVLPTGVTPVIQMGALDVSAGDIILLSDCDQATWVQACAVSGGGAVTLGSGCTPGNVAISNYNVLPSDSTTAIKLASTTFYIGKRGIAPGNSTNPPSLFRQTLGSTAISGNAEELVEGIENMQVLYGEKNNNDSSNVAARYVPADDVSTWTNVVSVRISVLVQSTGDNIAPAPLAYSFNGITYDGTAGTSLPPDRRLRRTFTSTINLRNRTLGN